MCGIFYLLIVFKLGCMASILIRLFCWKPQSLPIENEIDIFQKPIDDVKTFRQACPTFKSKRGEKFGMMKKIIQNVCYLEIFFDNNGG